MKRFNDNDKSEKGSPQPHPDSQRNYKFMLNFMKNDKIKKIIDNRKIHVKWIGTSSDPLTGAIRDPLMIQFTWRDDKDRIFVDPLSFHINQEEFLNEVKQRFNLPDKEMYA